MSLSDLGAVQQQTNFPELVQDEDVGHHRCHSHDFWSLLVILQLLVSNLVHSFYIYSDFRSRVLVYLFLLFPCCYCFFSRHFGQISSVFFVLIPELVFMLCLFGYLVFMVVFKWIIYTPAQSEFAPSILIHFIDMFLFTENAQNPQLYTGQVCDLFISLKGTCRFFNSCSAYTLQKSFLSTT